MIIGYEPNFSNFRSGIESYSYYLLKNLIDIYTEDTFILYTTEEGQAKLKEVFQDRPNLLIRPIMPSRKNLSGKLTYQFRRSRLFRNVIFDEVDVFHFLDSFRFVPDFGNSIVTVHDLFPLMETHWTKDFIRKGRKRIARKFRSAVINSKLIIANSDYTKESVLKFYRKVRRYKIHVTHLAASPQFRKTKPDRELLKNLGIEPDQKFFLFVGRIDHRKNIEGTLRAYSLLSDTVKSSYKLVCVAEANKKEYNDYFENLLDSLDIRKSVIQLKNINEDQLVHIYNAAFCLLLCSFAEGFGIPILEAFNCDCPVITSNCSSMPEVAGDCALYADPERPETIRDAIIELISEDNKRELLIREASTRSTMFDYAKTAAETYEIYKKLF